VAQRSQCPRAVRRSTRHRGRRVGRSVERQTAVGRAVVDPTSLNHARMLDGCGTGRIRTGSTMPQSRSTLSTTDDRDASRPSNWLEDHCERCATNWRSSGRSPPTSRRRSGPATRVTAIGPWMTVPGRSYWSPTSARIAATAPRRRRRRRGELRVGEHACWHEMQLPGLDARATLPGGFHTMCAS